MISKKNLRLEYLEKRKKLSPEEIEDMSLAIANNCIKLPIWNHHFYHLFLTITKLQEINTEYLLQILFGKDKNIIISKSDTRSNAMQHYLLTDNTTIKPNKWGIPEPVEGIEIKPEQIDVVFVPLLVADQRGHRVGYGKGYYDVFLKDCKPQTIKVGLSFFNPANSDIPNEENDIALDYLITPESIYAF